MTRLEIDIDHVLQLIEPKTASECVALREFRDGMRMLHYNYPVKASDHFRRAVSLEPSNPYFLSYLGLALGLAEHRWEEAERLCETALRLKRNQAQLHLNLAHVYLKEGKKAEAVESLEAGLRFTGKDERVARVLRRFGARRPPVFSFLRRSHFLNRYAGRVRHAAHRLFRAP